MQTFLPYSDFKRSAQCLDNKRLGKQRVEAWQILLANQKRNSWSNHPAVLMWRGYDLALSAYGIEICKEWIKRGYQDSMMQRFKEATDYKLPLWFGNQDFHAAHRSNLLRKNPDWYSQFDWTEAPDLEYVWPVRIKK